MTPPIAELADLLTREPVNALEAWLADSVRRWMADTDGLQLHRYAGLGGPITFRQTLRDHYLMQAADLLPGPTTWKRAVQLKEAARTFTNRKWDCWCDMAEPPTWAKPIEAQLWHARHVWGAPLPTKDVSYLNILTQQDPDQTKWLTP